MLDPKEGKIRTCIFAKRHLSIFLIRDFSNGAARWFDKDTIGLLVLWKGKPRRCAGQRTGRGIRKAQEWFGNRLWRQRPSHPAGLSKQQRQRWVSF